MLTHISWIQIAHDQGWYIPEITFAGMRAWRSSESQVSNFPFPLPPEPQALAHAQRTLVAIGALEQGPDCPLTATGRAMAGLPLSPRHARMVLQVWSSQSGNTALIHLFDLGC